MGDQCGMVCGDAELLGANVIGGVLFWPSTLISVLIHIRLLGGASFTAPESSKALVNVCVVVDFSCKYFLCNSVIYNHVCKH